MHRNSDEMNTGINEPADLDSAQAKLSYKFQRLREKLRETIVSGEFTGKLPGERVLAKRFGVNAKTLSKALTDLAAEGLLDRSIGRGTYVKGSAPATPVQGRWLVLSEEVGMQPSLVQQLRRHNPDLVVCQDMAQLRPSFINGFSAILDLSGTTPQSVVRDLVVRNLPVLAVGYEPDTFSMHCVTPDLVLAASKIGRDLLLAGHRRLVAVEPIGQTMLSTALRQAVARYAPEAVVESCCEQEVQTLLGDGAVAFVCGTVASTRTVRQVVADESLCDVAVVGIGYGNGDWPGSGYYVAVETVADVAANLLADPPARPTSIWLTCSWVDLGTVPGAIDSAAATNVDAEGYACLVS